MRVQRLLSASRLVSLLGDGFVFLALPLLAIDGLGLSASFAAMLFTATTLPGLLGVGLGPLVDRSRNPLHWCLAADVMRAVVQVAAVLAPSKGSLLVAAVVLGLGSALLDIALEAYLPRVLQATELGGAYSSLARATALARIGGLAAGGVVIAWHGAATALLIDAASFVMSALILLPLLRLTPQTPGATTGGPHPGWRHEIGSGVRILRADPPLAGTVLAMQLFNITGAIVVSLWTPFTTGRLGLSPATVGLLSAAAPSCRWSWLGASLLSVAGSVCAGPWAWVI